MDLFEKDLFEKLPDPGSKGIPPPLADRMRPGNLSELVGQGHLTGEGKLLQKLLVGREIPSLILWGPPGSGKTTLAQIIAGTADAHFVSFSAVLSGIKEVRAVIQESRRQQARNRRTILFVDEIHRFNKAQQDAFLPHVEQGTFTLIGATTENPSFEVINPLLSRCRVLVLEPLNQVNLKTILQRAVKDPERGLGKMALEIPEECLDFLARTAHGDARYALNALETAAMMTRDGQGAHKITLQICEEALQARALLYDKAGEEHYNVISAFIKSMRASDPDAALYWLARMLEAGEDPLFIVRRMVIFASEDIGNADPQALQVAMATRDAFHFVGLPEGWIPLAHGVTYLACAPKSNASYTAYLSARKDVKEKGPLPVPLPLRNAPTPLMKNLGYGKGYQYPHEDPVGLTEQGGLPEALKDRTYYRPKATGQENAIREQLEKIRKIKKRKPRS